MSQLFKTKISIKILLDFLEKINCQKTEHYYIVDITAYKRSVYIEALKPFLHELREFYYASKYNYIDPENINQNKFNTIVRQICKYTNTHYENERLIIGNIYYYCIYWIVCAFIFSDWNKIYTGPLVAIPMQSNGYAVCQHVWTRHF